MADDIGDGVEWLQWLLTNDLEAVGGHRPSTWFRWCGRRCFFVRRMADGCCLSIEAKIGGIYVRRTDSRLEYGVTHHRLQTLYVAFRLVPTGPT